MYATSIPLDLLKEAPFPTTIWGYVRCMDKKGSGRVVFSIKRAASFFGRSSQTILRWCKLARKDNFFRNYQRCGDRLVVYYSNPARIALGLGINRFSAIAECFLEELRQPKVLATRIAVEYAQNQSIHAAAKAARRQKTPIASPETIVDNKKRWKRKYKNQQPRSDRSFDSPATREPETACRVASFTFVSSEFITYGSSQRRIASISDRSERTVRRHTRELRRTQLLKKTSSNVTKLLQTPQFLKRIGKDAGLPEKICTDQQGNVYEYKPNIYTTGVELKKKGSWRAKIRNLRNHSVV